jgi:hypothetical protein
MKKFAILVLILFTAACGNNKSRFRAGTDYIRDPGLNLFVSSLTINEGVYVLKSYFRSSVRGRTEYIYENLDITIPALFEVGREYPFDSPGVTVWYAKGGFAGQIETTNVSGSFKILEKTDRTVEVRIDAEFYNFVKKGVWDEVTLPASIRRRGTIISAVGNELYQ